MQYPKLDYVSTKVERLRNGIISHDAIVPLLYVVKFST